VPLLALIAIFVLVPLAELYVIYKVGDAIGILPTLAILVLDSLIGSMLLKSQGRQVWQRFNGQVQSGHVPHREILDGVLVIFGGAFLITPGFLTDIIGILLLLPPTRSVFRGFLTKRLGARAFMAAGSAAGARVRAPRGPAPGWDVDGTARERDDEPEFELPPRTPPRS
jgi:UPF0716 protein FxsA